MQADKVISTGYQLIAGGYLAYRLTVLAANARALKRLAPTSVLISRGRSNAYGHPHPQVMARYRALGSRVYDSAEQGAVSLRLGAFQAPTVARSQRRFWREPLP